jgi:hypothetical protein
MYQPGSTGCGHRALISAIGLVRAPVPCFVIRRTNQCQAYKEDYSAGLSDNKISLPS